MASHPHTVLVVEDDPLIRLYLAESLEDEGYGVLETANVLEAVAALGRCGGIAAMVTDIDMPGSLNGLDLARLVRGYDRDVVIIVTSGGHVLGDTDLPERSRFLSKPYKIADVLSILANGIAGTCDEDWVRLAV